MTSDEVFVTFENRPGHSRCPIPLRRKWVTTMTSARQSSDTGQNPIGQGRSNKIRARLANLAGVAVIGTFMCAAGMVSPAGASGSSIGSFTLSGQVVAKLKTSKEINVISNIGGSSIPSTLHGCQVGQPGTGTDVINLPDGKVVLNGHSAKATAVEFSVPFDGKSDTLTSSSNQLSFALEVGKLSYLWVSSTGTITTTSKGQSGTFSVTFDPSATGVATGNDHATKPLHVSGSWTSCTPWP